MTSSKGLAHSTKSKKTRSKTKEAVMTTMKSKAASKVDTLVSVAPSTKQHMVKPRTGFEPMAQLLASVARAYPEAICLQGIDLEQLAEDLAGDEALTQPIRAAILTLQKLEGTRFVRRSNAWRQTLLLLDRARSAARTNPDVLGAIAEVEAFMKQKPRKKAVAAPSAAST